VKKRFLTLIAALGLSAVALQADSCSTAKCNTPCAPKAVKKCDDVCPLVHGKTYLRHENSFQMATPVYASMFETNSIRGLEDDRKGSFQVAVYGGKNTKNERAAAYYLPCGHRQLTFDGAVTPLSFVSPLALSTVRLETTGDNVKNVATANANANDATFATIGEAGAGATADLNFTFSATGLKSTDLILEGGAAPATIKEADNFGVVADTYSVNLDSTNANFDNATFYFDTNRDTSIIRPWNFGITFASLFEPTALSDGADLTAGMVTNPSFKSTINPHLVRSQIGAGMALRYHFSEDKRGFFGEVVTSVENVRSRFQLNENVITQKDDFTAPVVGYSTTSNVTTGVTQQVKDAYYGLAVGATAAPGDLSVGFTVDEGAPASVTAAFNQATWKFGKITDGCTQSITRLADIELLVGYGWDCSDCAYMTSYVGLVIPTGNRPNAQYVAAPVVGNGFHVGFMTGHVYEMLLSSEEDCGTWKYRLDTNARYLFRNTQQRSFDLCGSEWSRYMMVWEDKEAYVAALSHVNGDVNAAAPVENGQPSRGYKPGINSFTTDMKVTPGFQVRLNNAVFYQGESLRAEFGWNTFARQAECAELACGWTKHVALADASYLGGVGLNSHRTIYNDAQTSVINNVIQLRSNPNNNQLAADSLLVGRTLGYGDYLVNPTAPTVAGADYYDQFEVKASQINLESATSPSAITQTPYASVGYAWENCDYPSQFSVGGSYTFNGSNAAHTQWLVWGKFDLQF